MSVAVPGPCFTAPPDVGGGLTAPPVAVPGPCFHDNAKLTRHYWPLSLLESESQTMTPSSDYDFLR